MNAFDRVLDVIETHWGFSSLRPLQEGAIRAELEGRDSLVVLPTGGGKSLCYQAPAVASGRMTVVVSPLISLMKDQVDALDAVGVSALQIDSMQSEEQRSEGRRKILEGKVSLLYVSPNRLLMPQFQDLLRRVDVGSFVIDEAHCISQWGHDFWPEYRQLRRIRESFPQIAIHAYTATATEQVRRDVLDQLQLADAEVLVGNFDRPNLSYRIVPRHDVTSQVLEVLGRHRGEAGIVYCIRKRDVDELVLDLKNKDVRAVAYHAGLPHDERRASQERFSREDCDVVVATVAFGMGIDRSNVRFVLHTGLPKSIEHYQQETGRAGRDGLEAECVLLYSGADVMLWRSILERSSSERDVDEQSLSSSYRHLEAIDRFCRGAVCRHRMLVEHFGQAYEPENCQACDLCLGETSEVADAHQIALKVLSCVARVRERFGIGHVVDVLRGANTERIRQLEHDKLSTYALMKEHAAVDLRDWVYQLIGQGVLEQERGEYPTLRLNAGSREVLRGQRAVRLVEMKRRVTVSTKATEWNGVDRDLFEKLRVLRREIASRKGVPPFVIFADSVLRQLAAARPSTSRAMLGVSGIGETKLEQFGAEFLGVIRQYCAESGAAVDQPLVRSSPVVADPVRKRVGSGHRNEALALFRSGATIELVADRTGRTIATVVEWLAALISEGELSNSQSWIAPEAVDEIGQVASQLGRDRLKPLYLALDGRRSYDEIRLALSVLESRASR